MDADSTPQWLRNYAFKEFPVAFNPVEAPGFAGLFDDWPVSPEQFSFVNCPFKDAQLWIEKAAKESQRGAMSLVFVPAMFNSVYFRESVYPHAREIIVFTCPIKLPGKNKQLVAQTSLLVFAARDEDAKNEKFPFVTLVDPEGWQEEYYKRDRNRSRFASTK